MCGGERLERALKSFDQVSNAKSGDDLRVVAYRTVLHRVSVIKKPRPGGVSEAKQVK